MANNFQALNSLNFSGSNALRQAATEQIKQGLNQGQQAFSQFNTGLTNRATQEGINQIRNLDSRAAVEASPLNSITPQYANQATLQAAYDANKTKQQGLYEDDMLQQGLSSIQGIKSLEDYGNTSADQILNQFGQNLSAAKQAKLQTAYNNQDDAIKQQMTADTQWNQQQQTLAEKPVVDKLSVAIQGSDINTLPQVQEQINGSNLSDQTKASLLAKAEQRGINSSNILNARRTESGYQAQQNLYKFAAEAQQDTLKAKNDFTEGAAKAGIKLNNNFEVDTTGMSIADAVEAERAYAPLVEAFKNSTVSATEFNDYLTTLQGVESYTPAMLKQAKADYEEVQADKSKLSPELQANYDEQMSIVTQTTQSQIDNLNRQKATVSQQYQDVAEVTNKELSMTLGDATQAARTNLSAQGMDIDSGDMSDLMGFLKNNLGTEDPYILAEVAKVVPIVSGGIWPADADFGWYSNTNVKAALDKVVKDTAARRTRAMASLDAIANIDQDIIQLNNDKLSKGKQIAGKLSILNPKVKRSLFQD